MIKFKNIFDFYNDILDGKVKLTLWNFMDWAFTVDVIQPAAKLDFILAIVGLIRFPFIVVPTYKLFKSIVITTLNTTSKDSK